VDDRPYFPPQSQALRVSRMTCEAARLADAAKHLRRSADRVSDIRGEGALVAQLRAEANRLLRKRGQLMKDQGR
jgi:hypothetical protein